jgi:hypothetical protein
MAAEAESKALSVKLVLGDEVHRRSLREPSVVALRAAVAEDFPRLRGAALQLQYDDDEGDRVTLSLDEELADALQVAARMHRVLRVLIKTADTAVAPAQSADRVAERARDESTAAAAAASDASAEQVTVRYRIGSVEIRSRFSWPLEYEVVGPGTLSGPFTLKYVDEDGDQVVVASQEDLDAYVETLDRVPPREVLLHVVQPADGDAARDAAWASVGWPDLEDALLELQRAGFTDGDHNRALLRKHGGAVERALAELRAMQHD